MLGQEDTKLVKEGDVPVEEEHASFASKSPERALIAVAGPAANFLLAIAVFLILNLAYGKSGIAPIVSDVVDESPAFLAQLKKDDEILLVDGTETFTWQQVNMKMLSRLGETGEIKLTIARPGIDENLNIVYPLMNGWQTILNLIL